MTTRRRLYWVAVALSVALLAGGVVIGALGYAKSGGPDGAVRGYFDALARSDAAGALAYGDVPPGPHALLTGAVLREQQRIAPLRHFAVVSTRRTGAKATVTVKYTLAFPGQAVAVSVGVPVHESDGDWRLDRAAVATQLLATSAAQRQTIVGGGIPAGTSLMFPGALPVRLDTPYLELAPNSDYVTFGGDPTTAVVVQLTATARADLLAALRTKLTTCLTGAPDATCPLPDERYVPGSVRGSVKGEVRIEQAHVDSLDPVGRIDIDAAATVTGTYRRLDFHNRPVSGHGDVVLAVDAWAYAVRPLTVNWRKP